MVRMADIRGYFVHPITRYATRNGTLIVVEIELLSAASETETQGHRTHICSYFIPNPLND